MDDFLHCPSSIHDGKLETAQFLRRRFFYYATRWQPGLAFFYGGLVHRNSVMTIMMQVHVQLFYGPEMMKILCVANE